LHQWYVPIQQPKLMLKNATRPGVAMDSKELSLGKLRLQYILPQFQVVPVVSAADGLPRSYTPLRHSASKRRRGGQNGSFARGIRIGSRLSAELPARGSRRGA